LTILVVAALLTAGAVVYTLYVRPQDIEEEVVASPTEALEERKAQIYDNLRDLQDEYLVRKVSESDYQKTKGELQHELARVTEQIEAAGAGVAVQAAGEAEAGYVCPHCQAVMRQKLKFCGECGGQMEAKQEPAEGTVCPHCSATFEQPMKFCGECGKSMTAGGAA
jgi:hypothetical protein